MSGCCLTYGLLHWKSIFSALIPARYLVSTFGMNVLLPEPMDNVTIGHLVRRDLADNSVDSGRLFCRSSTDFVSSGKQSSPMTREVMEVYFSSRARTSGAKHI